MHNRFRLDIRQHDRQTLTKHAVLRVDAPGRFLLRYNLCAASHEPHTSVVVGLHDGFDEGVGKVKGSDGFACRIPHKDIGGGERWS